MSARITMPVRKSPPAPQPAALSTENGTAQTTKRTHLPTKGRVRFVNYRSLLGAAVVVLHRIDGRACLDTGAVLGVSRRRSATHHQDDSDGRENGSDHANNHETNKPFHVAQPRSEHVISTRTNVADGTGTIACGYL